MPLDQRSLALLRAKNFAYIATVNKDGSPQVTPVWVDTDGKNILVNTAIGRVKERNLARDPRVSIAVYDKDDQYHGATIRGVVVRKITGKEADDHIDSLSFKYVGNAKYERTDSKERVILIIEPIRISER